MSVNNIAFGSQIQIVVYNKKVIDILINWVFKSHDFDDDCKNLTVLHTTYYKSTFNNTKLSRNQLYRLLDIVYSEEMKAIPDFAKSQSDLSATKFQIVLKGDASKPLSMIKSFKWLATQADINNAQNFTDNLPEEYLLADPTTPEAQAAAAAKAKEDAKIINRVKRKFKKG
jgi:hypothetical protein